VSGISGTVASPAFNLSLIFTRHNLDLSGTRCAITDDVVSVELATIGESSPWGRASPSQELPSLNRAELAVEDHISPTAEERREAALQAAQSIARFEMARRRRRLGNLTLEQESGIEVLLISTVNRISELISVALESPDGFMNLPAILSKF
jgi:hypothetical protein